MSDIHQLIQDLDGAIAYIEYAECHAPEKGFADLAGIAGELKQMKWRAQELLPKEAVKRG